MTLEEHMFFSRYIFEKIGEVKRKLKMPLEPYELHRYENLSKKRREVYEQLAYVLITNLKIDFKNHPPF